MKKLLLILILPLMIFTLTGCKNEYIKFIYEFTNPNSNHPIWYENGILVTDYEGNKKDIEIPSEIDGYKVVGMTTQVIVTAMQKGAVSFKIPDTVIRIINSYIIGSPLPIGGYKPIKVYPYPNGVVPFLEIENGVTYVDGWVLDIEQYEYKDIVIKDGTRGIIGNIYSYNHDIHKPPTFESLYIPGSIKIIPEQLFYYGLPNLKKILWFT